MASVDEKLARSPQRAIEERLLDISRATAVSGQPDYGGFERWMLALEPYRLLLNPYTKRWLYFDLLHETWDDSGIGAGEGDFQVIDGSLVALPLAPSESSLRVCPACQADFPATAQFCSRCGTQLGDAPAAG